MEADPVRAYGGELAVVTVTCSGRPDPERLLGSLPAATSRPVRAVVADRASAGPPPVPDGVETGGRQPVEPAGWVNTVCLAEDVGRSAAVNRAVAALPGAVGWVAVAVPEVRWCPGALDALLAVALRYPRAGLIGPRLAGPAGPVPSGGALPGLLAAALAASRGRCVRPALPGAGPTGWLSTAAALLRRAAWDSVDGLDPRYLGGAGGMGDVDLGERLGGAGWLVVHAPGAQAEVGVPAGDGHGILEPHVVGLRRYVHDRGRAPARALLALAGRTRHGGA